MSTIVKFAGMLAIVTEYTIIKHTQKNAAAMKNTAAPYNMATVGALCMSFSFVCTVHQS